MVPGAYSCGEASTGADVSSSIGAVNGVALSPAAPGDTRCRRTVEKLGGNYTPAVLQKCLLMFCNTR